MNFIPNYKISELRPADYNPRVINPDSFESLKESLQKFGIIKPIILNGNGVLTAGHQRIKAMKEIGFTEAPVIMLKNISLHDEIKFNLFHNSIETNKSRVIIKNIDSVPFGYSFVTADQYECGENKNSAVVKSIADLYVRYGNWGSVVADDEGNIILNSDYALAMKTYKEPILVYKLSGKLRSNLLHYLGLDYGEYNFKALNIKPYVQLHCQMNRVKSDNREALRSSLYETVVLERISRDKRIVDFGAGKFAYVNYLKEKGFKIFGYEPFFRAKSRSKIDIGFVLNSIMKLEYEVKLNGLFDVVVLDSVINSITSNDYQDYVLTSCNALMKPDGVLYLATRTLESAESKVRASVTTQKGRSIEFLDKDNFSATFREGVWTLQKFHSKESLTKLLTKYFLNVTVSRGSSQHYAVCKNPIQLSDEQYLTALTNEFNIEYPNNYRHNKHEKLVNEILKRVKERNVSCN